MRRPLLLLAGFLAIGCSCGAPTSSTPVAPTPSAPAVTSYEVHEWGLVRGTVSDHVMISGPHADEPVMVVTKPVLYFHLDGEGPLLVDVEARIPNGQIVEHWPTPGGAPGTVAAWHEVMIQGASCHGSRYPTLAEDPCNRLSDGCEAATLAEVETTDSNCLYWPRPPGDDGPTQAWNNLFYRGEITGTPPALPLHAEPLADGTVRLTTSGTAPIPGHVIRIFRGNGVPSVVDALVIAAPPAPGSSVIVGVPSTPVSAGGEALGESLREAGLTPDEIGAFRRSWDETLFGNVTVAATITTGVQTVVTTTPTLPIPPRATTSLLYILPPSAADALATLSFSPPPTAVRRAIAVWVDETEAH